MKQKKIIILGGYGNAGFFLTSILLKETNVAIILAGRNEAKVQETADQFNQQFEGNRVKGRFADASNSTSLKKAFAGTDMVVVVSTTVKYVENIVNVSLEIGIDYYDITPSNNKLIFLNEISDRIRQAGRCFITEGGAVPGTPTAISRYMASDFDNLKKISASLFCNIDWSTMRTVESNAIKEFLEENDIGKIKKFKKGKWTELGLLQSILGIKTINFGKEIGSRYCLQFEFLEESKYLPEKYPSLEEFSFYSSIRYLSGYYNPIVEYLSLVFPFLKHVPGFIYWRINKKKPPFGGGMRVELFGEKNGKQKNQEAIIYHEHVYKFTVIPVVACLQQYLDGAIEPGLHFQALAVEPNRFMKDLEKMGITVRKQNIQ
ncbi:MAG: saccharopine dehydrogenase NADP-binding domain-containing protein [Desulfobacteraceae bacterium]|jgi:saccharopine dehydrogenase (NAD+, L-lysine-forming)